LTLAEKAGDIGFKLQAHHASWATSFGRGRFAEACAHGEAGLALYDAKLHQAMASSYGNHNASTCARYFMAISLAFSGEHERARAMAESALEVARSLNDPFSLGLTFFFSSAVAQVAGDVALAARHAAASRQIATEHDLAMLSAWSTGILGWCIAESGELDRGIAMLTDAMAGLQATQSRHLSCYLIGLSAELRMKAERHVEAMQAVQQGIALAEAGERYYVAELHRLKGELLACAPDRCDLATEEAFRAAIDLAKQQGAKALQHKATASFQRWSNNAVKAKLAKHLG
jgi:predicted ATPase